MKDTTIQNRAPSGDRKPSFKPVIFGNYCLIDRVSQGGMSDVYLAKTSGLGGYQKPLIIKKLLPRYSTKARYVKRFINEAKTLARLSHSNIVQVFDIGQMDGDYYIAMEYIEGRNAAYILAKARRTAQPLSIEFVLYVALGVAQGLAYAHRKKGIDGANLMLVHQDVNSFNVMISYEAEIKLIDFGIARVFLNRNPIEGFPVAGKLLYFSPEQLQNKSIDRRVDIYGIGILLYELVTRERLIEHQDTVGQTVRTILEMDIREKVQKHQMIPSELKPILIKAMAFNPEDRYPWMEDFISDLRDVVKEYKLDLNPSDFANYMNSQFRREIILDTRRMRKLLTYKPSERELRPAIRDSEEATTVISLESLSIRKLLDSALSGEGLVSHATDSDDLVLETVAFSAGSTIYLKGDPAKYVYIIQKGQVRIWLHVGQSRKTLALPGAGDFFGEGLLLGDNLRTESAEAEEDCVLIPMDQKTFEKLIGDKTAVGIVLNILSRLGEAKSIIESDLLGDSLSRLIYGLLFFHRRLSVRNGKDIDLGELTDLLQLEDKDQIMKYLTKLEEVGIVQISDNIARITDPQKLENILKALSGRGKLILKV
ncbi:MAG: protein kinase domain-containing protein [Desulfomonilaceae bacterium]